MNSFDSIENVADNIKYFLDSTCSSSDGILNSNFFKSFIGILETGDPTI